MSDRAGDFQIFAERAINQIVNEPGASTQEKRERLAQIKTLIDVHLATLPEPTWAGSMRGLVLSEAGKGSESPQVVK